MLLTAFGWFLFFDPTFLFPYSSRVGHLEIRSDRKIQTVDLEKAVSRVDSRLRKFEFYNQVSNPRIFMVFSNRLKKIYNVEVSWESRSLGISPIIYIGMDESIVNEPTFYEKLEYVISYEASLKMVQFKLGFRAFSTLPLWVKEGVGEWISAPTQYQLSKAMMMFRMAAPEMTKEKGGKRRKAHMLIAYLIEKEGKTLSEILNLDLSEESVLSEMF